MGITKKQRDEIWRNVPRHLSKEEAMELCEVIDQLYNKVYKNEENMNIAITFTDQNPDGGAVIGKETYIVPVDEKYIPIKVVNEIKASSCRAVEITIVKN